MGRKRVYYFTEVQEQAVIDYSVAETKEEKNRIYDEHLKKPFQRMVESILRRYPVHIGNYNIDELERNALSHLAENAVKYDPNKILKNGNKPRAFSYCQTIVRNFFKDHSKKSRSEILTNLSFDDYVDEVNRNDDYLCEIDDSPKDFYEELLEKVIDSIKEVIDNENNLKKNEVIVGYSIINILENWHILFQEEEPQNDSYRKTTKKYAKNKILLLLKEQTGLNTKEIRNSMKHFKILYMNEKNNLLNI